MRTLLLSLLLITMAVVAQIASTYEANVRMCFFKRNGTVTIWQAKGDPTWNKETLCFEDTLEYQTIPLAEYFRYSLPDWPSRWNLDTFALVSRHWPGDPNWVDPRPPVAVEDPNDYMDYDDVMLLVNKLINDPNGVN